MVFTVLAALITSVGGEVEEVPDVRCPEIRARFDHAEHMLMIKRLVFLGIVALLRVLGVEGRIGVRAVFGEADDPVGVLGVVFVEEFVRLLQLSQVPAEIEVLAVDIGNLQNGAFNLQHKDVGHGCQARRIEAVAKIVQEPMVLQQFLVDGAGGGDLIAETPDRDAGVIIALGDQFPHLAESILPPVCHMRGDIGDLGPDNDAVFIAEIVELLCVLIMGQPQGVGAQLPDDGHVGRMVFIRQGVPPALEILVAAHTAQRIAAPVEEEALVGIAGKDAAAKAA